VYEHQALVALCTDYAGKSSDFGVKRLFNLPSFPVVYRTDFSFTATSSWGNCTPLPYYPGDPGPTLHSIRLF